MKRIELEENGLHMALGRDGENRIRLLHFGQHRYEDALSCGEHAEENCRIFEVQVSGVNQNSHRGGKNIASSEGCAAVAEDIRDARNALGRRIEIVSVTPRCRVTVSYQFYDGLKAVTAQTEVECIAGEPVVLEHVSSFCLYGLGKEHGKRNYESVRIWQSYHSWYCEGQWKKRTLADCGVLRVNGYHAMSRLLVSNTGSWSSKESLPMGAVEDAVSGEVMLWQIESGGSWNYEIGACANTLYVNLFGPSGTENHWYKKLKKSEIFRSVPATVTFGTDFTGAVREMIGYRRRGMRAGRESGLPVVYNPYMHDCWDYPDAAHLSRVMEQAAELGAEIFCIDAGWHDEQDIMKYIGLWQESKSRFPLGLAATVEEIKSHGMRAGLWLEIETVGERSPLRERLPRECFFLRNGASPIDNGRMQLDFSSPLVRRYADETVDRLVRDYGITYLKMDYNHDAGAGTEVGADSFGDGLARHVEAYLKFMEDALARHPCLTVEYCASGGLRMDYAHMRCHSACSSSDQTNYRLYPYIAANIAVAGVPEQMAVWCYPFEGCGREEAVFNVVNTLLGRMQLSGGCWKQRGENRELLIEGVRLHRRLAAEKCAALPFWPLGLAEFFSPLVCAGFKTERRACLAVWNLGAAGRAEIPLGFAAKNLRMTYPAKDTLRYGYAQGVLTVEFTEAYQARFFEMDLVETVANTEV